MLPEAITDADLRAWLARDFHGYGRCRRLAGKLGVSIATASSMMSGKHGASLVKAAAHYGYAAGAEQGTWIKSSSTLDPRCAGYVNWRSASAVVDRVQRGLEAQQSIAHIARRIGVPAHRVGYAARRHLRDQSSGDRTQA